jgi:phosphatidylinositol-3,4,5-trisphosphate 3-phosphatase/dual-specificity protein phosphatase PTEN
MSDMHAYLLADPQNVAVIHCLAGKGRTGTVITCYLLFSGLFKHVEDASRFFAIKRSVNNWGVTGPSQQRYIEFFHSLLLNKTRPSTRAMQLKHIIVLNCPKLSVAGGGGKQGFVPNIVISDTNVGLAHKVVWQTKEPRYD